MSETKHTPEPWVQDEGNLRCVGTPKSWYPRQVYDIVTVLEGGPEYRDEANSKAEANAHRIVACVNALAGVDDPAAELARLRRVEQAARAYVEADPDRVDMGPLYDALKQAVGR